DNEHKGWLEGFWGGIKYWQIPGITLPRGRMRNVPTEMHQDELLTRSPKLETMFKLYGILKPMGIMPVYGLLPFY
ncbi:hypothetical protein ACHAW6_001995, partial [Cyclotella cf. meneghiniana]